MSFKVNSSQQISFNDSVFSLTAREKKALDNSWAKIFADEIFPNIDEERFSVLYSSKASRPNAPVNVIIGALKTSCSKKSVFLPCRQDNPMIYLSSLKDVSIPQRRR